MSAGGVYPFARPGLNRSDRFCATHRVVLQDRPLRVGGFAFLVQDLRRYETTEGFVWTGKQTRMTVDCTRAATCVAMWRVVRLLATGDLGNARDVGREAY